MAVKARFPVRQSLEWENNGRDQNVSNARFGCYVDNSALGCQHLPEPPQVQTRFPVSESVHSRWQSNHTLNPGVLSSTEDYQAIWTDKAVNDQQEALHCFLWEQRNQQTSTLTRELECKALPLLKHKDDAIAQLSFKEIELQSFIKKLELEKRAWQRACQESEVKITSLRNAIEKIKERISSCSADSLNDAESCCYDSKEVEVNERTACSQCRLRNSCMVYIPCKHLSSCKVCEPFLYCCPLCQTGKTDCIEAVID